MSQLHGGSEERAPESYRHGPEDHELPSPPTRTSQILEEVHNTLKDSSHPGDGLFELWPSEQTAFIQQSWAALRGCAVQSVIMLTVTIWWWMHRQNASERASERSQMLHLLNAEKRCHFKHDNKQSYSETNYFSDQTCQRLLMTNHTSNSGKPALQNRKWCSTRDQTTWQRVRGTDCSQVSADRVVVAPAGWGRVKRGQASSVCV